MIVTAEPYYAVTQPSDVVVMENVVRKDTRGVIETIDAKYELLPRGMYTVEGKSKGFLPVRVDKKNPFELYEAENAVMLARIAGADKYAADSYQKALDALAWAHRNQAQKPGQKPVITMAREAVLRAEDSRVIAIRAQRKKLWRRSGRRHWLAKPRPTPKRTTKRGSVPGPTGNVLMRIASVLRRMRSG